MSLHASPLPARADASSVDEARPLPAPTRLVRAGGLAMATGAAAWAVGTLVYDLDPVTDDFSWVYKMSSLLFQLGLVDLRCVDLVGGALGVVHGHAVQVLGAEVVGRGLDLRGR